MGHELPSGVETDSKVRYLAEWASELIVCPETGDVKGQKDASAPFDTIEAAAKHGCEQNCYGSECFVSVQEWGYDGALYEDTGRKRWSWWDSERYLCQEGEVIERVD